MPDNQDATQRQDDSRASRRPQQSQPPLQNSGDEVSLITTAKRPRLDDWRHRKRVYAALQLARIPLIILAVVAYAWLHSPILAAFFAVVSLPLPWIAVLLANEKASDTEKGQPKVYKPALVRQERQQAMRTSLETGTAGTERLPLDGGDSAAVDTEAGEIGEVIDAEPEEIDDTDGTGNTGNTENTENTERSEDSDER